MCSFVETIRPVSGFCGSLCAGGNADDEFKIAGRPLLSRDLWKLVSCDCEESFCVGTPPDITDLLELLFDVNRLPRDTLAEVDGGNNGGTALGFCVDCA